MSLFRRSNLGPSELRFAEYEEVARIDGYAKGFYLYLMKKAL